MAHFGSVLISRSNACLTSALPDLYILIVVVESSHQGRGHSFNSSYSTHCNCALDLDLFMLNITSRRNLPQFHESWLAECHPTPNPVLDHALVLFCTLFPRCCSTKSYHTSKRRRNYRIPLTCDWQCFHLNQKAYSTNQLQSVGRLCPI